MRQNNQIRNRQAQGNRNQWSQQPSGGGRTQPRWNTPDAQAGSGQWGYDQRDRGQQEQFEPWGSEQESGQRNFGTDSSSYDSNRGSYGSGRSLGSGGSFDREAGRFHGGSGGGGGDYGEDVGGPYSDNDRGFSGSYGNQRGPGDWGRGGASGSQYGTNDRGLGRNYPSTESGFGGGYRNDRGSSGRYQGDQSSYGQASAGNERGGYGAYGNNSGLSRQGESSSRPESRGPKNYRRSDERIREEVCDRLMQGGLNAEDVDVQVKDGQVTLSGNVDSRQDKRTIEDLAEEILGVKEVQNQLRVQKSGLGSKSEKSSTASLSSSQAHSEGASQKGSKS